MTRMIDESYLREKFGQALSGPINLGADRPTHPVQRAVERRPTREFPATDRNGSRHLTELCEAVGRAETTLLMGVSDRERIRREGDRPKPGCVDPELVKPCGEDGMLRQVIQFLIEPDELHQRIPRT